MARDSASCMHHLLSKQQDAATKLIQASITSSSQERVRLCLRPCLRQCLQQRVRHCAHCYACRYECSDSNSWSFIIWSTSSTAWLAWFSLLLCSPPCMVHKVTGHLHLDLAQSHGTPTSRFGTKPRDTYISIWHKAMQGCRTCGALVLVIARSTGRQADVASSGYLREHRAVAVGLAVVVGFHIRRACMQHVPRVLCVCARVLFRGARGNMCDGRASSHQAAARMQIHARIKQCGDAIKPDWEQVRRGQAHRRRHSW